MLVLPFEAISVAEAEQVHRSPYTDTVNNNSKKSPNSQFLPREILSYLPQPQTSTTL